MSEYGLMSDKTNMETLLAGVALIPTEDHMEQFISFRKQCGENVSGPILSLETNLPHVTILQCPFKISELKETQLQGILQQFLTVNPNYDPSTDPFYDPNDPKGKFNPNMGSACQSCGQYALTISETKKGMFNKKTVDTKLVCANCGKIQSSNLGLFL